MPSAHDVSSRNPGGESWDHRLAETGQRKHRRKLRKPKKEMHPKADAAARLKKLWIRKKDLMFGNLPAVGGFFLIS